MTNVTMTTPSASSRPLLDRCPGCGGGPLFAVFNGEDTNFLCRACSRCWHVGLGWVHRVDPVTCPGCEWQGTCLSRFDCTLSPGHGWPHLAPEGARRGQRGGGSS